MEGVGEKEWDQLAPVEEVEASDGARESSEQKGADQFVEEIDCRSTQVDSGGGR